MARTTTAISRPQRWDVPFGPEMTEADADRVLGLPPISAIDPSKFTESVPLRGIIANDSRLVRVPAGKLIVREGEFGDSVFFILSGSVKVIANLPAKALGRAEPQRRTLLGSLAQLWTNHRAQEFRDVTRARQHQRQAEAGVFLHDVPGPLDEQATRRIEAGEYFGEIAALTRMARSASVFAESDCELLEMRWQGFREIWRRSVELREQVDRRYRERSLLNHLRATPIFRHLTEAKLQLVADQTAFETYGDFDWYVGYKKLGDADAAQRLAHEPIIAEEGSYPNSLIMVRAGFVRVSTKFGHGERTMSYLGPGKTYGFQEIAHNFAHSPAIPLQRTLRAVGYVAVLRVPTRVIERYVLKPGQSTETLHQLTQMHEVTPSQSATRGLRSSMVEFLVENRFINGSAAMIIDLDRCTRCDDCVRACAEAHDNNPRFLRHGQHFDHTMIANACMHCEDPVCLIGCPTGAIHRHPHGGQVVINDDTCIGCATCANSCPYSNIRMVEIRDQQGDFIVGRDDGLPLRRATKCDLCVDQLGGPACQRACPHDALKRVDMADLASLEQWLVR